MAGALLALGAGFELERYLRPNSPSKSLGQMTEFALPDLKGKTHNIKEWNGSLILLNFWATWCPPCREEIPLLITLQQRYGARGLQVIGIAIDRIEAVSQYRQSMGIGYPILLGGYGAGDILAQYGNSKGVLPYNVIITSQGKVISQKFGAYTSSELEPLIQSLLPKSP